MTTATTITELRTTLLEVPWHGKPPETGLKLETKRDIYVLEIETQGGLIGMSYLMPLRGGLHTIDAGMKELVAPHVIGRDATEIEAIWTQLYRSNFWLGRMGVTVFAQSAVDMALWDIVGKRAGLPLFRLWGAVAHRDPGLRLGLFRGLGRDGMIARAKEFTAHGAEGDQDAGGAYPAVARGRAERQGDARGDGRRRRDHDRRQHGLGRRHRHPGRPSHRRVRSLLAGGAGGRRGFHRLPPHRRGAQDPHRRRREPFHRNDLRPFFEAPHPVPILQPDPMRGGFTELRKIAAAAEPWGIRLAPHLFHETMVHLLASIPNASWLEYMTWNDDLWIEPILPSKTGTMTPPERPGHGLAFRPEILKDHRIGGQRIKG